MQAPSAKRDFFLVLLFQIALQNANTTRAVKKQIAFFFHLEFGRKRRPKARSANNFFFILTEGAGAAKARAQDADRESFFFILTEGASRAKARARGAKSEKLFSSF